MVAAFYVEVREDAMRLTVRRDLRIKTRAMPIYEYECQKCHETTEVMQKMSDPAPAKCPKCGSKKLQRVMSQTSFQLKGEGWYITDYSRKDKEKKAASSKKKGGDSESSGAAASESKAEAKTEKKKASAKAD
jgi:putative FmdB family regulatory protein